MNLETAQSLSASQFKCRFDVRPDTFNEMVQALQAQHPKQPSPGHPAALSAAEEMLATLEYRREY